MELVHLDQVQLILSDVFATELVGRAVEIFGEPPDRTDVCLCGSSGVV
jgi:hypothetical protein